MINAIKFNFLFIVICLLMSGCAQPEQCVDGINKMPMFGGVKKCSEQIETDKKFITEEDKVLSRKQSSEHFIKLGWQNLYANKLDTATMRFNQAWLLDSLNAAVYWGFGNILGKQGKFKESLPFFERSVKLDSTNVKVLQDLSTSYGNVFFKTKDEKYLHATILVLTEAAKLEPRNAAIYAQLTGAYSYFAKKDSANKYLKITDQIDPKAVNPEVRKMLTNK